MLLSLKNQLVNSFIAFDVYFFQRYFIRQVHLGDAFRTEISSPGVVLKYP